MIRKNNILIGILVIGIIILVWVAVARRSGQVATVPQAQNSSTTVTSLESTTTPNYTVTQVPAQGTTIPQPVPDLTHGVTFSASAPLTPDVQTLLNQKVSTLEATLKKDPTNVAGWIQLGIYQKMAGDFTGTVTSWKYAVRLAPTDHVPLGDLADLYGYYLHDNTLAEQYYIQAITQGPTQAYLYVQYATFCHDVLKDTTKAQMVITQGLVKIPNDSALLQFQANLK